MCGRGNICVPIIHFDGTMYTILDAECDKIFYVLPHCVLYMYTHIEWKYANVHNFIAILAVYICKLIYIVYKMYFYNTYSWNNGIVIPSSPPQKKRTEIGWSIAGCIIPRRLLIHNNDWWMQLYIMRGYYFSSDHMNVFFCRYILTMYIEACVFQLIRI